jgi:hypothetical protein
MASYVFNKFKADLMAGNYNLQATNNTYTLALVTSAAFNGSVIDLATIDSGWDTLSATYDITNGSGYNTSGYSQVGLSGCSVTEDDTNNVGNWSASSIVWDNSTIDANGYVIYKTSNKNMICAIDFGSKLSTLNAQFSVSFPNGILNGR